MRPFRRGLNVVWRAVHPLAIAATVLVPLKDEIYESLGLDSDFVLTREHRLETSSGSPERVLALKNNKGDLDCWARVWFRTDDQIPQLQARTEDGVLLDAKVTPDEGHLVRFTFRAFGAGNLYFNWPSGHEIVLSPDPPLRVSNWSVFTKEGQHTQWKARTRSWVNGPYIVLVSLTVLLGVAKGLGLVKELNEGSFVDGAASQGPPAEGALRVIISSVSGSNSKETKQIQTYLTGVLVRRVSATEAMTALGELPQAKRRAIHYKAKARIEFRLAQLPSALGQWQKLMMVPPPF